MVKNYNEVIETAIKSTVQIGEYPTEVPISDDKPMLVELYEKKGGR